MQYPLIYNGSGMRLQLVLVQSLVIFFRLFNFRMVKLFIAAENYKFDFSIIAFRFTKSELQNEDLTELSKTILHGYHTKVPMYFGDNRFFKLLIGRPVVRKFTWASNDNIFENGASNFFFLDALMRKKKQIAPNIETENLEEANNVEETENLEEANNVEETENLEEANNVEETENLEEANNVEETENLEEANNVEEELDDVEEELDDVEEELDDVEEELDDAKSGLVQKQSKYQGASGGDFLEDIYLNSAYDDLLKKQAVSGGWSNSLKGCRYTVYKKSFNRSYNKLYVIFFKSVKLFFSKKKAFDISSAWGVAALFFIFKKLVEKKMKKMIRDLS